MKYTLDTIPVLDAYKTGCECPLCQLRIACEDSYVDSMLGAAYMEPDCRVRTNEVGFCTRHFQLMYDRRNRLGLALMTHTHMQEVISSVESILKADEPARGGLLASLRGGRDEGGTPQKIRARMSGCVICEQMESAVNRYAYTIARRYKHIRIYCTPRLMNGLLRRHNISRRIKEYQENVFKEIPFKIADFTITAFDTSHDGTDNMGFMIENDNQKFVVAPDMGIINARTAFYTAQANYLMIESNYDARMLNEGSYPEYLKQRIRKDTGHLDNEVTAKYVADIYSQDLKYLFLCHLSNDNNTPEIAVSTMRNALQGKVITVDDCSNSVEMRNCDIQLSALPRYDCSPLIILTD